MTIVPKQYNLQLDSEALGHGAIVPHVITSLNTGLKDEFPVWTEAY